MSKMKFKDNAENNFDGIRLALALIVVFVHVATLTSAPEFRFWRPWLSSVYAVKGFFAISGFLVTQSYLSSRSNLEYFEKRGRRIYPAYFVTILGCLLIGAIVSDLDVARYFTDLKTWKYLFANLAFMNFVQPTLPGVFQQNVEPFLNGALWTIKIEVCLYFILPFIIFSYRKFDASLVTVLAYAFSIAWLLGFQKLASHGGIYKELSHQFPGQLSYFVVGAYLAYTKMNSSKLRKLTLFSGIAFLLSTYFGFRVFVEPLFYASITIFLATGLPWKLYRGKYGDFSYGIYLVHFPIVQLLIWMGAFKNQPFVGLAITLVLVVVAAVLMWQFVEKGFLKRSPHKALLAPPYSQRLPKQM